MGDVQFHLLRETDAAILKAFTKIRDSVEGGETTNVVLTESDGVASTQGALHSIEEDAVVKDVLKLKSSVFRRMQLNLPAKLSVHIERLADGVDQAVIRYPDNATQPTPLARAVAACREHLAVYDLRQGSERLLGKELTEFYRRREQALHDLERFTQTLIEKVSEHALDLERAHTERRTQFDSQTALERDRLRLEYEERANRLQAQEGDLLARTKELDDRSSKHARRQIHKDIKAVLENRSKDFSLSSRTQSKRLPLHLLFVGLMVVPGILFVHSIVTLWGNVAWTGSPADWLHLFRLPLSGVALAAAIIFYIRWNDQWFREHAEEEFRLKRFDLDIDRASWVVEMMLEWKDERGSNLPGELIERLTQSLFVTQGPADRVRHPGQDLASALLQASSGLSVAIPGVGEAKLNAKGMKKFQQQAGEEARAET